MAERISFFRGKARARSFLGHRSTRCFLALLYSSGSRFLEFQHLTTEFGLANQFLDQSKYGVFSVYLCLPMRK
jgi:hypothetical protein